MISEKGKIIQRLLELKADKERLEAEETMLWKRVYDIADDTAGEGKPYRYIDRETLMAIGRTTAVSETLDSDGLLAYPGLSPAVRKVITRTVVVVDPVQLEATVRQGKLPADLVRQFTTRKETTRKFLHAATKEEKAAIEAEALDEPPYGPVHRPGQVIGNDDPIDAGERIHRKVT